MQIDEAISEMQDGEIGLYYITKMHYGKERSLYIGKSTYCIKERLRAFVVNRMVGLSNRHFVRIGRISMPGNFDKSVIDHAEKALIYEHGENVLNILDNNVMSTKTYCYTDLYRIYNEGDIFELKPIVDMNEHPEL
jgi:hypothetical protein